MDAGTLLIIVLAIIGIGVLVVLFRRQPKMATVTPEPVPLSQGAIVLPAQDPVERSQQPVYGPKAEQQYITKMDQQYANPYVHYATQHPVLRYQMERDGMINPASYRDPIRIRDVSGPLTSGRTPYGPSTPGPVVGGPMGVPVPMGTLKSTNERYTPDMFRASPLAGGTTAGPYTDLRLGGIVAGMGYPPSGLPIAGPTLRPAPSIGQTMAPPGYPLMEMQRPLPSTDFYRPFGPNPPLSTPFFGSVNAYAPFPEITTPWEKAGVLTSAHGDHILNLYRRPIAPMQELWEYQVQDKDGFVIKLETTRYLDDGDVVQHVIGKNGMGPWVVHNFVQNKWIWV